MKTATIKIRGVASLQMGRYHKEPMLEGESHADHEERTWLKKAHADEKGNVFMPPMAFKNMLVEAAKYDGGKIKGKGNKTWTGKFMSGTMCTDPVYIGKALKDAQRLIVFGNTKGERGGKGPRVEKSFPTFMKWEGTVVFYILDQTITKVKLTETMDLAGKFIGLGVFRPQNGGYYGRFEIVDVKWE